MIWVLPEILFRDDGKDIQIYEDEPEPIFKLNIIQKFARTKLARYTTTFYKQAFKFVFEQFKPELDYITEFILTDNVKKLRQPPVFIIDDTDEDYSITLEDEDKANFSFLKWIKGIGNFFRKIHRFIRRVRRMWRRFKRAKKYIQKKFKQALKRFRKSWRKMRTRFKILKKRAKRFYKQVLKPWWKRMKKRIWRWCKKMKRILRRVLKKWKRVLKIFKRRVTKILKKVATKLIKKFAKKLFKRVIQQLLKWVAGLLSATGIGAIIGAALFAASIAWEVYDLTHGEEDDMANKGMQNQPVKENKTEIKKTVNQDYKPLIVQTEESFMEQGMQINMITQLQVNKHIEKIHDNISRTLFNSRALPYQIFGRLYLFWRLCANWLDGQQVLVTNLMNILPERTNYYFDQIMKWTESKEITELPSIVHQKFNNFEMIDLDVKGKKFTEQVAKKMKEQRTAHHLKFNPWPLDAAIKSFTVRRAMGTMYKRFQDIHKEVINETTHKINHAKVRYYMEVLKMRLHLLNDNIIYKITSKTSSIVVKPSLLNSVIAVLGSGEGFYDSKYPRLKTDAEKKEIEQRIVLKSEMTPNYIKIDEEFKSFQDATDKKIKLLEKRKMLTRQIAEMLLELHNKATS